MNRSALCLASLGLLLFAGRPSLAIDSVFEARPDEILLSTTTLQHVVPGIALSFPAAIFLAMTEGEGSLRLRVRAAVDLADLQRRAGDLVDTIPLPANNCDRRGGDDIEVRIWGKQLDAEGDAAILILHGDAKKWVLCKGRGFIPIPPQSLAITQPFDISAAVRLALADPRTLEVRFDKPTVTLGGNLGDLSQWFLGFLRVDLGERLKQEMTRAVNPDLLRLSLPQELSVLQPELVRAGFGRESSSLVGSIELAVSIDPRALDLVATTP